MSDGAQSRLDALLRPLAGDAPAGEDVRWRGVHDEIRELRREDDPDLPRGVWQRELKKADWSKLETLARETLETRSKDLQIAAWLAEAWTARRGVAGCTDGLRLVDGLCRDFWESVHPGPEKDVEKDVEAGDDGPSIDLEMRLAPIRQLDTLLPRRLQRVPMTDPSVDGPTYSLRDWRSALQLAQIARVDKKAAEAESARRGGIDEDAVQSAVASGSTAFYRRLAAELRALADAFAALRATLDDRIGDDDAPRLRTLEETMDEMQQTARGVLTRRADAGDDEARAALAGGATVEDRDDALAAAELAMSEADGAGASLDSTGGSDAPSTDASRSPTPALDDPIRGRADAYRRLAAIADYLERIEPHSPTPHLVRRAVAWGDMSLAELLRELVAEDGQRGSIARLLGLDQE